MLEPQIPSFGVSFTWKKVLRLEISVSIVCHRKRIVRLVDSSDLARTRPKDLAKWKVKVHM